MQPTGLFADIFKATIALASVTRVYDADVDLPTASGAYALSGVIGGDAVAVDTVGIAGAYADKNVASNINVTLAGLALSGGDAGNYDIASTGHRPADRLHHPGRPDGHRRPGQRQGL